MFSILYFFFHCLQGEREREREGLGKSLGKTCREAAKKGGCETRKVAAEREEGCCQNSFCLIEREENAHGRQRNKYSEKMQTQIKHTHMHKVAREHRQASQEATHSEGFACKCRLVRAEVDETDSGRRLVGGEKKKKERGWETHTEADLKKQIFALHVTSTLIS